MIIRGMQELSMYISAACGRKLRAIQVIQSMCIQSGELVIILGDKIYFRGKFFKSLRFRIMLLLIVIGIIPCIVVGQGIISNYEKRAVSVRTAEIQNQSTMLGSRLGKAGYLKGVPSETLDAELAQLADIYSGRILLIDDEFQVVKDTYDMEEGKTIISEAVMECYEGNNTSEYDSENHYIEVTQAIQDPNSGQTEGIMLVSVSTDSVVDSVDVLHSKAVAVEIAVGVVIITISFFISALLVRPFGRITQAIGAVTEGYDTDNKMLGRLKILDDSRQEFVSNVSHELKTPLTSMKVLADSLLAQEGAPAELYQEFMEDIAAEIERENKIINDLLSLVKLDKTSADLNIKSENINDLLELILKRLRPIAVQHNIEVVFESFRPVIAEVDEVKLTLAISNLVENAIKYNHEEGWVHVSLNADYKYFYIKVADSGIGIPEDAVEHIFERFYRVDKSHSREIGGTGLGLAIAKNAILMHRGIVKVHSKEGEGTTFTVRVPLTYIA